MKWAFTGGEPVEGLVFDMDGVLILSREAHAQAFREVLSPLGVRDFDYDRFAGWRTPEVFRIVLAEHGIPFDNELIARCSDDKSRRAREIISSGDLLAPGCVPVIDHLSRRYRLALASSGSRASVQAFLDLTGLGTAFRSVLCGDDVARAKPDPEIFRRSIEALELPADRCVVIEDAVSGIQAARSAGARAVGMNSGDPAPLTGAGAAQVVDSLEELAELLA
jgi:HAD superfamily hydrolase (TIGR01509 family)